MTGRYFDALEMKWKACRDISANHTRWDDYRAGGSATDEQIQGVASLYQRRLPEATPFFWEERICNVIVEAAKTIPSWTVDPSAFPEPYGFAWFERPLPLFTPEEIGANVGMLGFCWLSVPNMGVVLGGLLPMSDGSICQGAQLLIRWGSDVLEVSERDRPPDEVMAKRADQQLAYIAACMLFTEQKIVTSTSMKVPRSSQRRLAKQHWDDNGEVQVITLRKPKSKKNEDASPQEVEWHWQWIVGGHWTNQPYGTGRTLRRHQWIFPYVKGPEGLPLKPPPLERIYNVTR